MSFFNLETAISKFKVLVNSFVDLVYPPLCLHCDCSLNPGSPIFCLSCLDMLDIIDPVLRCPFCFSAEFDKKRNSGCPECRQKPKTIKRIASVFDYEGPAATFVKQLKYGGQSYLAEGGGAYLAAQFLALGWPIPHFVLPMPMAKIKRWERGYNQSALLATSCARFIGCPVSQSLRRRSGDFSQAGLDYKQRLSLNSDSFWVKGGETLFDKTLLLIDDVMTTGSSLKCCADALIPFFRGISTL